VRWKASWLMVLLCLLILRAEVQGAADPPSPPASGARPLNALLISWDGFDRSVVKELLAQQKLPNVAALISEGSLQDINVTGHATSTKPSHADMLTGLAPSVTGVVTNEQYQPIPEGYTIFERLQQHFGGPAHIRTIMVTSKANNLGGHGPPEAPDASSASNKGEPYYLTRRHLDVFDSANRRAPQVGPLCIEYLNRFKDQRFFAFFHFADPDAAGHASGIDSAEYRSAAMACDDWLGKIVECLKSEGIYDRTLVYVVTDHGFDPHSRNHNHAPDSWLATDDKAVTHGGILADVPATILARLGVDVGRLEPRLVGTPLTASQKAASLPAKSGLSSDLMLGEPVSRALSRVEWAARLCTKALAG
jgi:predicted AlkP superfamily pyrophosphatase or phosphodiesterase